MGWAGACDLPTLDAGVGTAGTAGARPGPAGGGRPPGRTVARAGRAGHGEDDRARRGGRRAGRGTGTLSRAGAGTDVQQASGRPAEGPGHGPPPPDQRDADVLDVPRVLLRAGQVHAAARPLRDAAAGAELGRAGRPAARAARTLARGRPGALADLAGGGARYARTRQRGSGPVREGARPGARAGGPATARRRGVAAGVGVAGLVHGRVPRGDGLRGRSGLPRAGPSGRAPGRGRRRPGRSAAAVRRGLRGRVPRHRPRSGAAPAGDRRARA